MPWAVRHAAGKDTSSCFCVIVQRVKVKADAVPTGSHSSPCEEERAQWHTKCHPDSPLRRQNLTRHSPALLQTHELCSRMGPDKSSSFQVASVCSSTPNCTSTSHAAASACCAPARHTTSQASCEGGVAASLKSFSLQSLSSQSP